MSHGPSSSSRVRTALTRLASSAAALGLMLSSLAASPPVAAQAAPPAAAVVAPDGGVGLGRPHAITFDHWSLMIDGQRLYVWSGELHYWRLPSPDAWRDVLQKMRSSGYNAVSIYFDWGFHSPAPGVYDFTGIRDVDRLLDMAAQAGIYVIARPGPYVNAETDDGGLPAWLSREPGRLRTNDPAYLAFALEWQSQIDAILARHQLTNGTGSVILYQVENEFTNTGVSGQGYMQALEQHARADGIAVPLTHNDIGPNGRWASGPGAVDIYGFDRYPQGFNCSNPTAWRSVPDFSTTHNLAPTEPMYIAEFQGGSFDPWGGAGYDRCHTLTGPDFERVFYSSNIGFGATLQSFYMTYGGTSWGWLAFPGVYTSYDYGAAIDESRQLTDKITTQKELGYLVRSVAPLSKTDAETAPVPTDPALRIDARANPDTGTQFFFVRHADGTSTTASSTHLTFTGTDGTFTIPQQAGTAVPVDGRDAKILVAGYDMDGQRLVYSTTQLMTHATIGGQDVAAFVGRTGDSGETALRYAQQPQVRVLSGQATSVYDPATQVLRVNYTTAGLTRVSVTGGGRAPLLLLLGDDAALARLWQLDTAAGPALVLGPYLARTAAASGRTLALTGDVDATSSLQVWAPAGIARLTWNGRQIEDTDRRQQILQATVPGPRPATLPALTGWRYRFETPEAQPAFDDSGWTVADHTTTNGPAPPTLPVLYADDYGFHHGMVWYRGHFTATGSETAISLTGGTGTAGIYGVWLDGVSLGVSANGGGGHTFAVPAGVVRTGADNVVSVLVEDMGHDEGGRKNPRGLIAAAIVGAADTVTWRLQGNLGGEAPVDPVRGVMNSGGLYGERTGQFLPGYPDGGWQRVSLPNPDPLPGVAWYRTTFSLEVPDGQDVPIALHMATAAGVHDRVLIFLNGWNVGQYVSDLGPQTDFPLPAGILRADGENTLALAVWSPNPGQGGLGAVSLVQKGNRASGLRIGDVPAPDFSAAVYGQPVRAAGATLGLTSSPLVAAGQTVTVTGTVTAVGQDARDVSATLAPPAGWTVAPSAPISVRDLERNRSATVRWRLTAPAAVAAGAVSVAGRVDFTQDGRPQQRAGVLGLLVPSAGLSSTFDNVGITDDASPGPGAFDAVGSSLSAQAASAVGLTPGGTLTHGGVTFPLPAVAAGQNDNTLAAGQTVALGGSGRAVAFLGASEGATTGGTGTIYYTDGSTQPYSLSLGDFYFMDAPATGNEVAVALPYLNSAGGGCFQGVAYGTRCTHEVGLFAAAVPADPARTVAAVSLPNVASTVGTPSARVSAMHVFSIAVGSPAAPGPFPSLAAAFDNIAVTDDARPYLGNLDGNGFSYSAQGLASAGVAPGGTVTAGGFSFTWPVAAAGTPDNVVANGQAIALSGRGSALAFLVSSGGQPSPAPIAGTGTVTYADGGSATYSLAFGNYFSPPAAGTPGVVMEPTLNSPAGSQAHASAVFVATVPLDPTRIPVSVTLPALGAEVAAGTGTGFAHVFAMTLA
jgi:beta-galactosidase GanA